MLTADEVKNIAALARIGVSEKEIEKYQKNLSGILDYFKKLEEIDTKNVEPIEHITGRNNISREDRIEELSDLGRKKILNNAPETKNGYVKVKSVL